MKNILLLLSTVLIFSCTYDDVREYGGCVVIKKEVNHKQHYYIDLKCETNKFLYTTIRVHEYDYNHLKVGDTLNRYPSLPSDQ